VHLTRFSLTGEYSPTQSQAKAVHDAVWSRTGPRTGVEHVTAIATPSTIELVLFIKHDIRDPGQHAVSLIKSIYETSRALRPWLISAEDHSFEFRIHE
jgi:hypothetical protein